MRAISGVLRIKEHARQFGKVTIPFDAVQGHGSDVGDAIMHEPRRVYEEGDTVDRYFHGEPAYMVNIQEAHVRGTGHYINIGCNCTKKKLSISWEKPGTTDDVIILTIGFLVMGL
jgi:hypothetical protein